MKKRIISGLILIAFVLSVIIYAPPSIFYIMSSFVALLSIWEYGKLFYPSKDFLEGSKQKLYAFRYLFYTMLIIGTSLPFIYYFPLVFYKDDAYYLSLLYKQSNHFIYYGVWSWALSFFIYYKTDSFLVKATKINSFVIAMFAAVMNCAFYFALFTIRFYDTNTLSFNAINSPLLFLYIIFLVSAADSGAYFTGRKFGKHKLSPIISPNKTFEGLFGGLISSCLVAVIFVCFTDILQGHITLSRQIAFIILSMIIVAFSVHGDLYESFLKRRAGIKDSSNIIPGHGGVLDRLDSMAPAFTIFSFYWIFIILANYFKF